MGPGIPDDGSGEPLHESRAGRKFGGGDPAAENVGPRTALGPTAGEAKADARIANRHLKGLRSFAQDHPEVARRVLVCLEPRPRRTEEGIDVLPAEDFAAQRCSAPLNSTRPAIAAMAEAPDQRRHWLQWQLCASVSTSSAVNDTAPHKHRPVIDVADPPSG